MTRYEIKCMGFGGQGIALMGRIIGIAASIHSDPPVKSVFTQSYGPESRGGASAANVVVETDPDRDIEYPYVRKGEIEFAICMSQESYDKYIPLIKEGGTVFLDPDMLDPDEKLEKAGDVYHVPATDLAEKHTGRRIVANIVMLGFVSNHLKIISQQALFDAMLTMVPPRFKELNKKAFQLGVDYAPEVLVQ